MVDSMSDTSQSTNVFASSSRDRRTPLSRAPRVNQVDADDLDEGLASMLGENVVASLEIFKSRIDIKPEIMLILKLVIFRYSIFDPVMSSTPGARLQNLKLASSRSLSGPSRRKLLLYLLLHPPLFPSYLLNRLRTYALSQQWPDLPSHDYRRKLWKGIVRLENAARVWELAGWTWFLWDGLYPSLLMRILGLRLIPSSPHVARLVSYEYMNRQLVWGSFTEFMMFAVPLLPSLPGLTTPSSLITPLKSLFTQPTIIDYTSIPLLPTSLTGKNRQSYSGPLANLPLSTCPICHLRYTSTPQPISSTSTAANIALPPIHVETGLGETCNEETRVFVPAQTDCWGGCRWCYYCIAGELAVYEEILEEKALKSRKGKRKEGEGREEEEKWSCLRCGGGVTRAWRVGHHRAGGDGPHRM